jgi:plastocyanin
MFMRVWYSFTLKVRKMFARDSLESLGIGSEKLKRLVSCAMLIWLLLCLSILTVGVVPTRASVDGINLFGSFSQGWGFTPGSISSPGPTITVAQGDVVNLTLTSQDGISHLFFVDYNGNGVNDAGEPASSSFSGTVNYQFTASRAGTFTYHCAFHPLSMFGTFTVNAVLTGPDVAVTNVTSEKTVVAQGFQTRINVTVTNDGNVSETFNVTAYRLGVTRQVLLSGSASSGWNDTVPGPVMSVNLGDMVALTLTSVDGLPHQFFVDYNGNVSPGPGEPTSPIFSGTTTYVFMAGVSGTFSYYCNFHPGVMHGTFTVNATPVTTSIGSQTVAPPLASGEVRVLTLGLSTTGVAFGNYTLTAIADTVAGEIDPANNNYTDGAVIVSIPGDISGDFKVSLQDLVFLAGAYGSKPDGAKWNPNADIDSNGVVGLSDLVLLAMHYGQHYP